MRKSIENGTFAYNSRMDDLGVKFICFETQWTKNRKNLRRFIRIEWKLYLRLLSFFSKVLVSQRIRVRHRKQAKRCLLSGNVCNSNSSVASSTVRIGIECFKRCELSNYNEYFLLLREPSKLVDVLLVTVHCFLWPFENPIFVQLSSRNRYYMLDDSSVITLFQQYLQLIRPHDWKMKPIRRKTEE